MNVRRWLLALAILLFATELTGVRAFFSGECSEHCFEDGGDCGDDCAPCACCGVPRSSEVVTSLLPVPLERSVAIYEAPIAVPEIEPQEILHIPICA